MIGLTQHHHYYLSNQPTDMRKGFDGLGGIVSNHYGRSAIDGSVYIFINRRRNRMKMLVWESGGYMLYYKRLEKGSFELPKPKTSNGMLSINWETLVLMISGIRLGKIVRKKRYQIA